MSRKSWLRRVKTAEVVSHMEVWKGDGATVEIDPEVLLALIFSHCFSLLLSIGKPGGVALDFQVKAITRQAW